MIHDLLCPLSDYWENVCDGYFCDDPGGTCKHDFCQCDLIAKVREDERRQEEARRMAKFGYWHDYRPELP